MNEGVAHHLANRLDAAAARYSDVVRRSPKHGDAWRLLGVVALQRGDPAARGLLGRAIELDPRDAAAHSALGAVSESERDFVSAHDAYAAARAIDATDDAAAAGLTRVLLQLGHIDEALAVGEAAIARGVRDASVFRAVGGARLHGRDYAAAACAFEACVQLKPQADAFAYLAGAYLYLDRVTDAFAACGAALAIDPNHAVATFHLGLAHVATESLAAATAAFERAVELGSEEAHLNLGTLYLQTGDYARGWRHFGWVTPTRRANPAFGVLPMWDGGFAPGKHLLVCHEQGVGDTIQFARFVRSVRERVASVTLACPAQTRALFETIPGVDAAIDMHEPLPLDRCDLWLPTVHLPLVCDAGESPLGAPPYLRADPLRIERFRACLAARPDDVRVGLVWSGNPAFSRNAERSCGLTALESLSVVPGCAWFALQQGAAGADRASNGMHLVPVNSAVTDFADTAAIVAQLDLVITVDTSVAHLAAALGRPTWVILGHQPDWRWQAEPRTSPWYPSVRLFRKTRDGSWAALIAEVAAALHAARTELRERRSPEALGLGCRSTDELVLVPNGA